VRGVHEKRRDFACPKCPKEFPDKSALRKHLRAVHGITELSTVPEVQGTSRPRGVPNGKSRQETDADGGHFDGDTAAIMLTLNRAVAEVTKEEEEEHPFCPTINQTPVVPEEPHKVENNAASPQVGALQSLATIVRNRTVSECMAGAIPVKEDDDDEDEEDEAALSSPSHIQTLAGLASVQSVSIRGSVERVPVLATPETTAIASLKNVSPSLLEPSETEPPTAIPNPEPPALPPTIMRKDEAMESCVGSSLAEFLSATEIPGCSPHKRAKIGVVD